MENGETFISEKFQNFYTLSFEILLKLNKFRGYDSDEDDDEEEGSDLDDFIDDSGDLDDLSRRDFEETLRSLNKNYDTKKWKMNERLIDERNVSKQLFNFIVRYTFLK